MTETLTDDKIQEYKEAFEMFDRDKDGLINSKELGNILNSQGTELSDMELDDLIQEVDSNDDKRIDMNEFLQLMEKRSKDSDIEEELVEAFKIFDQEGNGFIPTSEFRHIMITLGEKLTEEEVEEMIKEADSSGEGIINYRDFAKIILSK